MGTYGLFVPVLERDRCVAVLQAGVFMKSFPTEEQLLENWKRLSGGYPKNQDNEFLRYVRTFLALPLVGPKPLERLQKAMEWYGALLTGERGWREVLDYERECTRYFATEFGHRHWIKNVVIKRKFFRRQPYSRVLMDWEREELGMNRYPTTVFAVKNVGGRGELTDLITARKLQRAVFQSARKAGEMFSGPLGHYGALVLVSTADDDSPRKQKFALRKTAEELAAECSKTLATRVHIGVGRRLRTKVDLPTAYDEAVAALHLAEAQNRPVVFFEEVKKNATPSDTPRRLPVRMVKFLREKGSGQFHLFREKFVEMVLKESYQSPETVRRVFVETIHRMVEMIEERGSVESSSLQGLERGIEEGLESAPSLNEMIDRFERAADRLAPFVDRPYHAGKLLRLRRAQEAIDATPEHHWTLPAIARDHGFSVSAFSKEFARHVGAPFSEYLLGRRLEKAKRLLTEGALPLSNVSEECGFSSANYFFQTFKRKVGQPPGEFRRKTKE